MTRNPPAEPRALHVHVGRLKLQADDFAGYWRLLDADERRRALGIQHPLRQQRYVESHGRLRILLGEAVQAAPASLRIAKTEHGKPYLADYPSVAFNLSHTGDHLAVVWATQCRVGIDIEAVKPRSHLDALAERCFDATEQAHWRAQPEAERLRAFYRMWTCKEAFVKAVGQGIALGLQQCLIDPENSARMRAAPPSCGHANAWSLHALAGDEDICGAIATDGTIGEVKINDLDDERS